MQNHHYSLMELEKYKKKDVDWFSGLLIGFHLKKCRECRDKLACLQNNEDLIKDIREAISEELPDPDMKTYEKIKNILEHKGNDAET